MVWYDIWYDTWYDIWYDMMWCITWYDLIYDMRWHMIRYIIWYCMIWYYIWYAMEWYDIWCDIQYDMIWLYMCICCVMLHLFALTVRINNSHGQFPLARPFPPDTHKTNSKAVVCLLSVCLAFHNYSQWIRRSDKLFARTLCATRAWLSLAKGYRLSPFPQC